jgi:hypothetical protein
MAKKVVKVAKRVRTHCDRTGTCKGRYTPQQLLGIKPAKTKGPALVAQGNGQQACRFCGKIKPAIAEECVKRIWLQHRQECGPRGGDTPGPG